MKKRNIGILLIIVGLIWAGNEYVLLGLLAIAGGVYLIIKNKNVKSQVRDFQSNYLEVFPAWWNEHPAVNNLIKQAKENKKPYYGKTEASIKRYLENRDRIYEHDIIREPVYFEDEPTNPYNPTAVKIMTRNFGQVGYVPDADLEEVRLMLKRNPSATSELVINGGTYKTLDYNDDGEAIIETIKGKWSANVQISN